MICTLCPAPNATIRKPSPPSDSITRKVLQPIEPVEPIIATPLGFIFAPISGCYLQDEFLQELLSSIRVEQLDRLPLVVYVRGRCDLPGPSVSINQVNTGGNGLSFAYDLKIDRRGAAAIVDLDISRNNFAEVFDLADVLFQSFTSPQVIPGCLSSLTAANGVEHYPNDAAYKN